MPEQTSGDQAGSASAEQSGPGISEFVGKVLDQLSLSAWLPAAMLVGAGAVLTELHSEKRLDLGAAITRLTHEPLGILIVLFFALVLTTMITQAFGFEAIRFLEGYWGIRGSWAARMRIRYHYGKRQAIEDAKWELEKKAFSHARQKMIDSAQEPSEKVRVQKQADILELIVCRVSPSAYPKDEVDAAVAMGWRDAAHPTDLSKIAALSRRLDQYPKPHRILPTRLGNVLRATEDKLKLADKGDVEGLVIRNYDVIPPPLLNQHSQFRARLDMYCTLVFVFGVLIPISIAALWKFGTWHVPALSTGAVSAALTVLSYRAAIASGLGYGGTLKAIDRRIQTSLESGQK